jgi:hypothetical protein
MKRLSTIVALVGSLLMAGAFGVACSHQQRGAAADQPTRPLGQSTAMGPSDPTHELEVPQTNAPPVERVPTLSSTPQATPTPVTTIPAPTPAPAAPAPTAVPVPVTPIPPGQGTPAPAPSPTPAPGPEPTPTPPVTPPPPTTPPPPSTMPAPSVPPSMMPMEAQPMHGADAGTRPVPAPSPDAGVLIPHDASPNPMPVPRIDGGATPKAPR